MVARASLEGVTVDDNLLMLSFLTLNLNSFQEYHFQNWHRKYFEPILNSPPTSSEQFFSNEVTVYFSYLKIF